MNKFDQRIIKFNYEKNLKKDDFYVSESNKHILKQIDNWPKWEKNFLNINGENYSGKTHLVNIFLNKFKGIKFEANLLTDENLREIKIYQNIVLENLNENVNEKLIYTLLNIIDQENKYLIITSLKPIVDI